MTAIFQPTVYHGPLDPKKDIARASIFAVSVTRPSSTSRKKLSRVARSSSKRATSWSQRARSSAALVAWGWTSGPPAAASIANPSPNAPIQWKTVRTRGASFSIACADSRVGQQLA